jgi:hypothetical protein
MCHLEGHWRKYRDPEPDPESDPDPDPNPDPTPDPIVTGTDLWIRIRKKMSRIRATLVLPNQMFILF